MTNVVLEYGLYLGLLAGLAVPLGHYIGKVMNGERTFLSFALTPCEAGLARLMRVDQGENMGWKKYAKCVGIFSLLSLVLLFLLQLLQGVLPGNPQQLPGVRPDLAFQTAVSFLTNTNRQAYGGESTLSYLTQALGLTVQNFLSAGAGMSVLFALIRGLRQKQMPGLGSFWGDMIRVLVHVLLPLNLVFALCLVGGGVVQSLQPAATVPLLEPLALTAEGDLLPNATIDPDTGIVTVDGKVVEDAVVVTEQFVPLGPAASQISIKQTGSNGGGFFGANSAHPFENPSPFTNLIQLLSLLLLPAALCFTFERNVKNKAQGRAIFLAMFLCLCATLTVMATSEQMGTAQLSAQGAVDLSTTGQAGGNMEGKESRFGIVSSATWSVFTTAASNGAVNNMHDSLTPMGGLITLLQMQLGEVIFGGVGSGLYGMLIFALITVFLAGLMVGRTPEFLGKKIEPREMKWAMVACLATPVAVLSGSAIAALVPGMADSLSSPGPHGFSQLLYTYTSAGGNNGSAFGGFDANTVFCNLSLAVVMLCARFVPITAVLAIAGGLAEKRTLASTSGTLSTASPLFVFLLILVVLLLGALSFFPALSLGPIAEHFTSLI